MNTRHLEEGVRKRKPDLAPYRSCDDSRLNVNFVSVIAMCSIQFSFHTFNSCSGWKLISWDTWMSGILV